MPSRPGLDRASIVEAAGNLADEAGLDRLTLSGLAGRLGVRTPSLYNHIDGLDGLRHELALSGIQELNRHLERAAIGKESDKALESMLCAYRTFAHERPGVYGAILRAPTRTPPCPMSFKERFGIGFSALVAVVLGVFMAILDSTIVNVAIPKMMSVFSATQ
ncbi:MAG: TetR/AcrR family transcriptional regulator [Bacilli bacterium]